MVIISFIPSEETSERRALQLMCNNFRRNDVKIIINIY